MYGSGSQQLTSNDNRLLTVTVPALSAVVYESAQRIPRSDAAPRISLDDPTVSAETNSRMLVSANVGGSSFNEVTFYARVGNGEWKSDWHRRHAALPGVPRRQLDPRRKAGDLSGGGTRQRRSSATSAIRGAQSFLRPS